MSQAVRDSLVTVHKDVGSDWRSSQSQSPGEKHISGIVWILQMIRMLNMCASEIPIGVWHGAGGCAWGCFIRNYLVNKKTACRGFRYFLAVDVFATCKKGETRLVSATVCISRAGDCYFLLFVCREWAWLKPDLAGEAVFRVRWTGLCCFLRGVYLGGFSRLPCNHGPAPQDRGD